MGTQQLTKTGMLARQVEWSLSKYRTVKHPLFLPFYPFIMKLTHLCDNWLWAAKPIKSFLKANSAKRIMSLWDQERPPHKGHSSCNSLQYPLICKWKQHWWKDLHLPAGLHPDLQLPIEVNTPLSITGVGWWERGTDKEGDVSGGGKDLPQGPSKGLALIVIGNW